MPVSSNCNTYSASFEQAEKKSLQAVLAEQKQKLEAMEELNKELTEKNAELEKIQRESSNHFQAVIAEKQQKLKEMEKLYKELAEIYEELKRIDQEEACDLDDDDVECVHCGLCKNEKKISICRTCAMECSNIDVLNCETLSEYELRSFAFCNTFCLRRCHPGHEVVEFYPILSAIRNRNQLLATTIFNEKSEKASEDIKEIMEMRLRETQAVIAEKQQKLEAMEKLNNELTGKIGELEKNQGETCDLDDDDMDCVECGHRENEMKYSICRTCTLEYAKIDVLNCDTLSESQLKIFVICNMFCIHQKHFGHEIVEYYPIVAAIRYKNQVLATTMFNKKLDKATENILETTEMRLKSVDDARKVANLMTSSLRNARSSKMQNKLSDMLREFYLEIQCEFENAPKVPELDVEHVLEELKEKHKNVEMENLETEDLDNEHESYLERLEDLNKELDKVENTEDLVLIAEKMDVLFRTRNNCIPELIPESELMTEISAKMEMILRKEVPVLDSLDKVESDRSDALKEGNKKLEGLSKASETLDALKNGQDTVRRVSLEAELVTKNMDNGKEACESLTDEERRKMRFVDNFVAECEKLQDASNTNAPAIGSAENVELVRSDVSNVVREFSNIPLEDISSDSDVESEDESFEKI